MRKSPFNSQFSSTGLDVGFGFSFLGYQRGCLFVTRQIGEAWFLFTISSSDLARLSYARECEIAFPKVDFPNLKTLRPYWCSKTMEDVISYCNCLD